MLEGADALESCKEWQPFRVPDFEKMQLRLRRTLMMDGRNLYQPGEITAGGWMDYSVERA